MAYKDSRRKGEYMKEYYQLHKEEILKKCKKYREEHVEKIKKSKKKYYDSPRGREIFKRNLKHWRSSSRGKEAMKRYRENDFRMSRMVVGKGEIKCSSCGCNDERIVEINHVSGGGTKERKEGRSGPSFYRDIINGKRKTSDLNLLCKVCNSKHCLGLKYGKLPYKIIWEHK